VVSRLPDVPYLSTALIHANVYDVQQFTLQMPKIIYYFHELRMLTQRTFVLLGGFRPHRFETYNPVAVTPNSPVL
jgi:hypothetical protein